MPTFQVSSSADDATSNTGGLMNLTAATLDIQEFADRYQIFRFQSTGIPQGATITAATLEVYLSNATRDDIDWDIWGDDTDDSNQPTGTSGDIINRTQTSGAIIWAELDAGTGFKVSPSLIGIVQEIVDRPGFNGGSISIICKWRSGRATVRSYDGNPLEAAKLNVTYSSGGGGGEPPPTLESVNLSYSRFSEPYMRLAVYDNLDNLKFSIDGKDVLNAEWSLVTNGVSQLSFSMSECDFSDQIDFWDGIRVWFSPDPSCVKPNWEGDTVFFVLDIDDTDAEEEDDLGDRYEFTCYSADILLESRAIPYFTGTSQAEKSGPADTIILELAEEGFGATSITPVGPTSISSLPPGYFDSRDWSEFITIDTSDSGLAPDSNNASFAWNGSLFDSMARVASESEESGHKLYFGFECPPSRKMVFKVYNIARGSDLSSSVVLSKANGRLTRTRYVRSVRNERTVAWTPGRSSGSVRTVGFHKDDDRVKKHRFGWRETIARSANESVPNSLNGAAESAVEKGPENFLTCVVNTEYYNDVWGWGDRVRFAHRNIVRSGTIDSVTVSVEAGEASINATITED